MSSKINLLIINCRDFNFPHAGNVDVKLMRGKYSIKVKVITYLPKRLSTRTDYYISHIENFTWEAITNNGVREVYDELLMRLNYTDKFTSHYGYSDGDVDGEFAMGKLGHGDYLYWLTDTLFSFNYDKKPFEFTTAPITEAMRGVSEAMTHGVDAMIMAGKGLGKLKSSDISDAYEKVWSKELKVSPLAKSSLLDKVFVAGAFEGKIHLTPEQLDAIKKFGRK